MTTDYASLNITKRGAVFRLLSDAAWHAHYELAEVGGVRYSARLLELRRMGYAIETADSGSEQGRFYRMPSLVPGAAQPKRVKVLLEEVDVLAMIRGYVPPTAQHALADAHASFDTNRGKL